MVRQEVVSVCVCVCFCEGGWGEVARVCCDAGALFLGGLSWGKVLHLSNCSAEYKFIFSSVLKSFLALGSS